MNSKYLFLLLVFVPITLMGQSRQNSLQNLLDQINETNRLIAKDEVDLSVTLDRDHRSADGMTVSEQTLTYKHALNEYLKISATEMDEQQDERITDFYFSPAEQLVMADEKLKGFGRRLWVFDSDNPVQYADIPQDVRNFNVEMVHLKQLDNKEDRTGDDLLKKAIDYYNAAMAFRDAVALK